MTDGIAYLLHYFCARPDYDRLIQLHSPTHAHGKTQIIHRSLETLIRPNIVLYFLDGAWRTFVWARVQIISKFRNNAFA